MWVLAIVVVLGLGAFVFGIKELFTGERRPLIQAGVVLGLLFIGNLGYSWGVRGEILIFIGLSIVGGIRFFEK